VSRAVAIEDDRDGHVGSGLGGDLEAKVDALVPDRPGPSRARGVEEVRRREEWGDELRVSEQIDTRASTLRDGERIDLWVELGNGSVGVVEEACRSSSSQQAVGTPLGSAQAGKLSV